MTLQIYTQYAFITLIKIFDSVFLEIEMYYSALLLDRRSIDLSGAQEKEGHFHYKNFLRASK